MLERQVTCLVPGLNMETYYGHVRTPTDAIILFEACRIGLLPRVQRRLSEKERQSIRSGSIFVWDEREAGMRRWTDGKSWSASRVSGSFLTYREMEGKRGGSNMSTPLFSGNAPKTGKEDNSDEGPDGYRYKADGLMKQSFSITTSTGQHLHLISYYSRTASASQSLLQPSNDPQLRHIRPERGMYPESTVDAGNMPPVNQGPMPGPPYSSLAPHGSSPYGQHAPPPAGSQYLGVAPQSWAPPSPLRTPPPHYPPYQAAPAHHQYSSYAQHQSPYPQHNAPHADRPLPPHSHQQHAYPSPQPPPAAAPTAHRTPPAPAHLLQPIKRDSPPQLPPLGSGANGLSAPRHDSSNPSPKSANNNITLPPPNSGSTIPSISSLINGAAAAMEEQNRTPISPTRRADMSLPNPFNHHSDVRALRDLDRATFRA